RVARTEPFDCTRPSTSTWLPTCRSPHFLSYRVDWLPVMTGGRTRNVRLGQFPVTDSTVPSMCTDCCGGGAGVGEGAGAGAGGVGAGAGVGDGGAGAGVGAGGAGVGAGGGAASCVTVYVSPPALTW